MNQTTLLRVNHTKRKPCCVSCGKEVRTYRSRYCSKVCRQGLENKLNLAVGLLVTLNTRFAAFSFTDSTLYLHLLCNGSKDVLSFMYTRVPYRTPAQDLWDMIEGLGKVWHRKIRQTGKRYLATQKVLEQAQRNTLHRRYIIPLEEKRPAFRRKSLRYLKLTTADVISRDAQHTIKSAYRREVKLHHPDHGGSAALFREIHNAHLDLLNWVKNPRFTIHRGIPGKWSYDSARGKKWLPPARLLKTSRKY